jgi:transcription termination factor Rho
MSVSVKGTYEPAGNLGGYLRSTDRDYRVTANDVVVSSAVCKSFGLQGGEGIVGTAAGPSGKRNSKPPRLEDVESINGQTPGEYFERKRFQDLVPVDPQKRCASRPRTDRPPCGCSIS